MSTAPPAGPALTEAYLSSNKGPQVLGIIITFPCLAVITVSLRLYTRIKIVNNPSYEDFAITIALIFSVATSICQGFQVYNGMGQHIQALTMEQGIGSLKALFASIMMYNFGLTFTKISIILQYLRITIDPQVRKACWVLLYLTVLNCIQTFFTGIFSCYPVAKFWDDRIPGGCVNKPALWYANAGINIAQDLWLVILPIFILRKLVLPRREKVSLVLILGLGGFASLASVFRLHALYVVAVSKDITWDNPGTATWSAMELNIGIICASLPTLRAFLARYFPGTFSSSIVGAHRAYQSSDRNSHGIVVHRDTFTTSTTAGTIVDRSDEDVEKGAGAVRPTFLASDSEAESRVAQPGIVHAVQQPEMVQRAP